MVDLNIPRLTRVVEILEALPESQGFDITTFQAFHECGSVACAIGYAALDPILNAQGLRTMAQVVNRKNGQTITPHHEVIGVAGFNALATKDTATSEVQLRIEADGDDDEAAVDAFFGMNNDFFTQHFYYVGYIGQGRVTPLMVAAKLRKTLGLGPRT